jgi:hypothetical protein
VQRWQRRLLLTKYCRIENQQQRTRPVTIKATQTPDSNGRKQRATYRSISPGSGLESRFSVGFGANSFSSTSLEIIQNINFKTRDRGAKVLQWISQDKERVEFNLPRRREPWRNASGRVLAPASIFSVFISFMPRTFVIYTRVMLGSPAVTF